jgi:hypothetical protein
MPDRRDEARQGGSGAAGGTDVEPLRGGMKEAEGAGADREGRCLGAPPAPYHDAKSPEGGLSPRGRSGGKSAVPQNAPERDAGDVDREAGGKLHQERGDHENEAGNAPRHDPGASGAGERR